MEAYRIARCNYIDDLSGTGARLYGGRWNSKGLPVIYTGSSRSLAALEALAHIPQKNLTDEFCMAVLHIPDSMPAKTAPAGSLPPGWRKFPVQAALQRIGDNWLKAGKEALLKVPSVIIPEEYNYLINPLHPDARKINIRKTFPFVFDERLGGSK